MDALLAADWCIKGLAIEVTKSVQGARNGRRKSATSMHNKRIGGVSDSPSEDESHEGKHFGLERALDLVVGVSRDSSTEIDSTLTPSHSSRTRIGSVFCDLIRSVGQATIQIQRHSSGKKELTWPKRHSPIPPSPSSIPPAPTRLHPTTTHTSRRPPPSHLHSPPYSLLDRSSSPPLVAQARLVVRQSLDPTHILPRQSLHSPPPFNIALPPPNSKSPFKSIASISSPSVLSGPTRRRRSRTGGRS